MVSFRTTFLALLSAPLLALAQDSSEPNAPIVPQVFSASAGDSLALAWTPTTSGTVSLVLRTGNSANLDQGSVIASNLDNSGSYTWAVPSDTVRGSDYTIEIVSDDDPTATNYWPYFVIDSSVTVATTTASTVSLGAPTSSVSLDSILPSATQAVTGSSLNSVLSTASLSASNSDSMRTSASASSTIVVVSTSTSVVPTSSNAAGFQGMTSTEPNNAAPRATAMAGLLGVVALGALAL
nr:putative cell wall protein [Quercus suber]